jgi:hypothetical protein
MAVFDGWSIGTRITENSQGDGMMKRSSMGFVILALVLAMCGQSWAVYYNYSDFSISGSLAGTPGGAFPWGTSDSSWEQGTGYAWSGRAIMKFDYETASDLTLTLPLQNGTYAISVKDVFTGNSATNPTFPFVIQGQAVNVVASDANAWVKDYSAGVFQVTDGTLTIVVGNPFAGTGAWLGFSGFNVVPVSTTSVSFCNYSDFNISGTLAGTLGGAFPWASNDNAWEQGTGYAWTGKAIMKYDGETSVPLTLTMPFPNGSYAITVKDVFTNNSANASFPFTIQGQSVNVIATDGSAWLKDYSAGVFQVTNGTLTIVVGNPSAGTGAWLGFSGFTMMPVPTTSTIYYNYSDFNITGTLAGTKGGAFPWASGDNAWEQGTGYAWGGKNAIMKYDNEMASALTLTMPFPNGSYAITVKDVFTNNSANAGFPFTIQGKAMELIATDVFAWNKDYMAGVFEVTDGTLTIVVGNPYVGTGAWLGFTGFDIKVAPSLPSTFSRPENIAQSNSIVVDGSLTEWSAADFVALDQNYDEGKNPVDITEASYAAKWGSNGKIYVAVKVLDTAHVFSSTYDVWNARDAVEVYLHSAGGTIGGYSGSWESAQQYTAGIKNGTTNEVWTSLAGTGSVPSTANLQAAGKVDGQWLYYEFALTSFDYFGGYVNRPNVQGTLNENDVISLDVCVVANNGGYTGMKSENLMFTKYGDYTRFGTHKLVAGDVKIPGDANGDKMVDVGDLGILAANYGGSNKSWEQGDFNGDKLVDVGDLGILAANYGKNAISATNWAADYAKAFGTTVNEKEDSAEAPASSVCSALGLPLVMGLLIGLMLVKLEE